MKRLTGLFLAVCCLTLVQVQPVAPLAPTKAEENAYGERPRSQDSAPTPPVRLPVSRSAQVVIEVSKPGAPAPAGTRPKPTLPPIAFFSVS